MKNKKVFTSILIAFLLCMMFTFLKISLVHADPTYEYEHYDTNNGPGVLFYGGTWVAQTFTTTSPHNISSVNLLLFRYGTPGTMELYIEATTKGFPNGTIICSTAFDGNGLSTTGTGAWYSIPVTNTLLQNNVVYAIVLNDTPGDGTDYAGWRSDTNSGYYPAGNGTGSDNAGSSWFYNIASGKTYPRDFLFEVWGPEPLSVSSSPSSASIQIGQTQNFTATASGGTYPYTYQWYYSNNTAIGGNSSVLSVTPTVNGTHTYYCNVTDAHPTVAMSNTITLNVGLVPLSITFANTTSSRIGSGSTFYVNGTVLYNGTNIVPQSGLATIYVSSSGNIKGQTTSYNTTSGNFNCSVTAQTSIANWTYTVYAVNSLGPSVVNQTLYIVSDSLTITLNTDTVAPSGGSTAHMNATATYAYDGLNVTTLGVTIARNNTKYGTSTSWTDTEASGTTYNFTVQATNDTLYHLTAFTGNTLTISWGSTVVIEVSSIYQNSTHTGISQSVTLAYRVIFGGNGSDVTSGSLTINSTVHSITNGWCNFTVTDPNIELVTYAASGSSFPNTVFSQVPANPQVIWDEVNVALYFTSTSPQVSQDIVVTWAVTRLYDNSSVTNFNMTIYVDYAPVYTNITQAIGSITDSLQSSGSKTYSVGYFIDSTYNMTSYINTAQTVTWTSQGFGYNPITTTPAITYSVTVVVIKNSAQVVGVQIVINGQVGTTDVSGLANFTLAQGTYPITISSNGQLLYSGSVQISASTPTILIDLTPQPVIVENTNFVTLGIIVITVIIILALIASSISKKPSEKESWRKLLERKR
jgi:hypothetical protein